MRLPVLCLIPILGATLAAQPKSAAPACDRACLEAYVDRYLDAVIAHDPAKAPLAKNARFTENGQKLDLGDGLWNTMDGKGTYRLFITDVPSGQVTFFGSISEEKTPAMIALRLKIANKQITEVESFIQRSPSSATGFERIGYKWIDPVLPADRMTREEILKTANMYFSGMQKNDGKGDYPFADDCNRIENGANSTNQPTPAGQTRPDPKTSSNYSGQWSCMEQFKSGLLHFVTRIRDRRYVAIDQERGLIFAFGFFDHSGGDTRNFETPDGRKVSAGPAQLWTWQIAEVFQIEKGKIHQIQAIMERVPYGMNSGWSSWEDGLSDRGRDATK
ncbi:MAG TPA: hypothetical protein VGN17_13870 [Bryobacteraceae bacterium]|jgi:hypothetical protein